MVYESLEARITANSVVDDETGCWNWTGSRVRNACGKYYPTLSKRFKGKRTPRRVYVHRLVLELIGHDVKGKVAAHSCDNTLCCNPAHLRVATQSDNIKECVAKGRHNSQH